MTTQSSLASQIHVTLLLLVSVGLCLSSPARADEGDTGRFIEDPGNVDDKTSRRILVDRVAVRFEAAELGGPSRPRFIFARVLAFEARLEAIIRLSENADGRANNQPTRVTYAERDISDAIERHISEETLASLPVEPPLTHDEIRRRTISARVSLEQMAGGRRRLLDAAYAEGIEVDDLNAVLDRRVRASLYLDRMVAPMLSPSDAEIRDVWMTGTTPFRARSFDDIIMPLRQWYVSERLRAALASFFRSARSRIRIVYY